jgi:hypothetical protein
MRRPRPGCEGHLTAAHETPSRERTPPAARLCVRAPQEPEGSLGPQAGGGIESGQKPYGTNCHPFGSSITIWGRGLA